MFLTSCGETSNNVQSQDQFCDAVSLNDYNQAEQLVNSMIAELAPHYNPADFYSGYGTEIDSIKTWLEKKGCVQQVTLSPGITKTTPPQKEYSISFTFKNSSFVKAMDLLLGEKLMVIGFHDQSPVIR